MKKLSLVNAIIASLALMVLCLVWYYPLALITHTTDYSAVILTGSCTLFIILVAIQAIRKWNE